MIPDRCRWCRRDFEVVATSARPLAGCGTSWDLRRRVLVTCLLDLRSESERPRCCHSGWPQVIHRECGSVGERCHRALFGIVVDRALGRTARSSDGCGCLAEEAAENSGKRPHDSTVGLQEWHYGCNPGRQLPGLARVGVPLERSVSPGPLAQLVELRTFNP